MLNDGVRTDMLAMRDDVWLLNVAHPQRGRNGHTHRAADQAAPPDLKWAETANNGRPVAIITYS